MSRFSGYIRGLDPRLPRSVWTMEIGGFANAFGNGLAFPFLLIYLHNVRGFSLPMVGLIAATSAAAGIVTVPIAGIVVDRFGGKRTLIVALVVLAAGFGGYALVQEPWHAFLFAAVGGIGNGAFWPSQSALITGLAPQARRHAAFALQRVMRNPDHRRNLGRDARLTVEGHYSCDHMIDGWDKVYTRILEGHR